MYAIFMIGLATIGIWNSISHLTGLSEVSKIILKGIAGGVQMSEIRKEAVASIIG